MSLEGRLRVYIYPTNWSTIKEYYENQDILDWTTRKMTKMNLQECTPQDRTTNFSIRYSFSDHEEEEEEDENEDEGIDVEEEEEDEQNERSKEGTSEEESEEEEEEQEENNSSELFDIKYAYNMFDVLPVDI